jgi:hypothetical protein
MWMTHVDHVDGPARDVDDDRRSGDGEEILGRTLCLSKKALDLGFRIVQIAVQPRGTSGAENDGG